MKIKIKYFGSIAEETGKAEETIEMKESAIDLLDLKTLCFTRYGLEEDNTIQLAINQVIQQRGKIKDGDEIAFLPPYAGG